MSEASTPKGSAKKEQSLEEAGSNKILYFGHDLEYFKSFKEKYQELCSIDVEFQSEQISSDSEVQSLINTIRNLRPKVVMLDFSKNAIAMLHLARLWARQNKVIDCLLIGLSDYNQGKSMVIKSIMAKLPCVHVKSSEFEAVVHDVNALIFPSLVEDHGFATAEMSDNIKAYYPAKASLINENFLKIESDISLQPKQQVRIHNHWTRSNIMLSTLMMCHSQSQENLYYKYDYSQVLQMAHADPVEATADMSKEEFDKLQTQRENDLNQSKSQLNRWIKEHQKFSRPKFLKALIVDKEGHFYDNRPLTDSYIYVFRNQPFIKDATRELTSIKPQIIIWNLEHIDPKDREAEGERAFILNDMINLMAFTDAIKKVFQGHQPYLIVFNAGDHSTTALQKSLNYQNVLSIKDPMDVDMVLKMCEMLRNKVEPTLPKPKESDLYIDKNSDICYVEIESDITLLGCSENDLYFNSDSPIAHGTVLRVSLPVPMYITVCQYPEYGKIDAQYYGIIHGVGEEERQKLRRYINDIFFREHEQKKAEEQKEIEAQKQKYLEDKEKERLAAEAAEEEERKRQEEQEKELEEKAKAAIDQLDDNKEKEETS
ncbi:MAG: hypothetical protein CME62_05880 [Halobacteriovoraceae bacterium]|nr:hypothetical protein [Halobacteriovoraceae bacterium]|tara:strand:+ start:6960 stop:8756 length:1797 start_codon:yes stop_codon:yes gene_type:complete